MGNVVRDGRAWADIGLRVSLSAALLFALSVFSGCTLAEIRSQSSIIENLGIIQGSVKRASGQDGPIVVLRFKEGDGMFLLDGRTQADSHGAYQFRGVPGTYYIAAFVDSNSDGVYQPGEAANYHGSPTGVAVGAGQTVTVEELTIAGELPALSSSVKTEQRLALAVRNIGRVIRLDDPMFSRDSYSMGMWRPLDFLDRVGGGLLFLQNYEKDRIPVIFVHGINGGPTDLTSLVDSLDRNRFQPWVLYYPSGARLDIISDYLATAVAEMQSRHGFTRFAVVSHSMGGLVTRSFVKKYVEQYPARFNNLALVMTINSPMEGMPSAAMGVKAPFMIQSWRDLAPGSDFLEKIHAWSWPATVPYYLMFSYESGEDGDGVVALKSQIPFKLQREAARMYGFNNSHVGTLRDEAFLRLFSAIVGSTIE